MLKPHTREGGYPQVMPDNARTLSTYLEKEILWTRSYKSLEKIYIFFCTKLDYGIIFVENSYIHASYTITR